MAVLVLARVPDGNPQEGIVQEAFLEEGAAAALGHGAQGQDRRLEGLPPRHVIELDLLAVQVVGGHRLPLPGEARLHQPEELRAEVLVDRRAQLSAAELPQDLNKRTPPRIRHHKACSHDRRDMTSPDLGDEVPDTGLVVL
jgi:hypothetical protein